MKLLQVKAICGILIFLLVSLSSMAQDFTVNRLSVDIHLSKEGYFDVIEKYDIDFNIPQHGIIRDIGLKYFHLDFKKFQTKRNIYISDVEVPGNHFKLSDWLMRNIKGKLLITIGDSTKLVSGDQQYTIHYRVKNAIISESNKTQLYWNIKTSAWPAIFKKIDFQVHIPPGFKLSADNCFTYSGLINRKDRSTLFDFTYKDSVFSGSSKMSQTFQMRDNVTVLIDMPPSFIASTDFSPPFIRYGWMIILGGFIFIFFILWLFWGRDKKLPIDPSTYPPGKIDSVTAGFLLNNKLTPSCFLSLLPKWEEQGYIKITKTKAHWWNRKKTEIVKLKELPTAGVPAYETSIFVHIFSDIFADFDETDLDSVTVESLKKRFKDVIHLAVDNFLKIEPKNYYTWKSIKLQYSINFVIVLVAVVLSLVFYWFFDLLPMMICLLVCIVLFRLSKHLLKKTSRGLTVEAKLRGFKQFLKNSTKQEIDEILQKDPLYLEKMTPYIVAFNLSSKWKQYSSIFEQKRNIFQWLSLYSDISIFRFLLYASIGFRVFLYVTKAKMQDLEERSIVRKRFGDSDSDSGSGRSGGGFGSGGGRSW